MKMEITIARTSDNKLDVRDAAGIRLMLLTEQDNKGLYAYFEFKMEQANRARGLAR